MNLLILVSHYKNIYIKEIMTNRKPAFIIVLLIISITNFYRIKGNENIRAVQFLSIFAIGILSGVLINYIVRALKEKNY